MSDVREGLANIFWDLTMGSYDMEGRSMVEQAEYKADIVLTYLHEKGVVRKVEGELPFDCVDCKHHTCYPMPPPGKECTCDLSTEVHPFTVGLPANCPLKASYTLTEEIT